MDAAKLKTMYEKSLGLNPRNLAQEPEDASLLHEAMRGIVENLGDADLGDRAAVGAVRQAMSQISVEDQTDLLPKVFSFIDKLIINHELFEEAFDNCSQATIQRKSNLNEVVLASYGLFDLSLVVLDEIYKNIKTGAEQTLAQFVQGVNKIKDILHEHYVSEVGRPESTRRFFADLDFAKEIDLNN